MDRALRDRLGGDRLDLASHETRVLAGGPELWLLESGSLAVSCAEAEDGQAVGPRRFLFRSGTGQPIWSVPRDARRALRLLAVPVEDARLRRVSMERVWSAVRETPDEAEPLISDWATSLSGQLRTLAAPADSQAISAPCILPLGAGEVARASEPGLWIQVEEGTVQLRGYSTWPLDANGPALPWTEELWFRAPEGARVRVVHARDLPDERALADGLARLESLVLADISQVTAAETTAEEKRLRDRSEKQGEIAERAARDLAGAFDRGGAPPDRGTPLMTAIGAICDTMKVELKGPAASEAGRHRVGEVEAIARATGVRTRRVLLEGAWWKHDSGPLLAYQGEQKHPVALLIGAGQRYELFDPVERTRTRLTPELESTLEPEAVSWYRPLPARKLGLKDLMAFSFHGRLPDIALMTTTAVVATLLGMLTPQATAIMMDSAIPDANRRLLLELGLALAAAAFGQVVFKTSQAYLSARVATRARQAGQSAVWDRLLTLRPTFFRKFSSGDLMDRAMSIHEIGEQLTGATISGLFSGLMALLNLALLVYYSPPLAGIAVVVAILTAALTAVSAALIRKKAVALQEAGGKFHGFQIQLVQGVSKLRVAGGEPRAYAQWMRRYAEQLRLTLGIARVEDAASVVNMLISSLSTAALFWFGYALLTAEGGLSIGIFLAFNAAYGAFLGGASGVSNTLIGLFDVFAASKRIQPILDEDPESDPDRSDPGRLQGRFAAEHVTFRYRDDGPPILEDVTIRAEPGEFIAIVGSSGSGKSTLLRVLLGFETPESGAVYYDGMDLAGVDVRAIRRQLGIVLQGGQLTQGSVMENIATGAPVSLDEAWDAVRKAGFEDDLKDMPMGMHTVVSEGGTNFSGGQRQRLLIARALVYKPKLLFFDEATSALDNRTQAIVSESLEQMNVTRLVIAHRLSTIRNADRIYVLDQGRVVQDGTFEELKDAEGLFARMMSRQMA